jgi:hypothetical protein
MMDKYDRDPWHDAETIPLWVAILIVVIFAATVFLPAISQF